MNKFYTAIFSSLVASAMTALVLIAYVLPVLFCVDPLGWAEKLRLQMPATCPSSATVAGMETRQLSISTPSSARAVVARPAELINPNDPLSVRNETVELTVPAQSALDYLLEFERDYDLDYAWRADKTLNSELRGEALDGKTPSKVFAKLNSPVGKGFFIIPFNGKFGWRWANKTSQPVTIRLTTKGHYKIIGQTPISPS